MKKLQTFFNLSVAEKTMFFKAYFLSAFVRFVTRYLPMRWWYKKLMGPRVEISNSVSFTKFTINEKNRMLKTIQIVRLACRYTPWKTKCLVESILVKKLVNKNLPIYLGLNKTKNRYNAHAWVIPGKQNNSMYKVVSVHI